MYVILVLIGISIALYIIRYLLMTPEQKEAKAEVVRVQIEEQEKMNIANEERRKENERQNEIIMKRLQEDKVSRPPKCPKCGSKHLSAGNKGFGVGKAAVGAVVAGPIGLVAGAIGSNKTVLTCLSCGHKFKPGN